MIEILKDYDLTKFNTFGIKAKAKYFFEIKNEEDLAELFSSAEFKQSEKLFLGGGSNILFTKDFDGIVILNKLKGIEIIEAPTPNGVGVLTNNVGKDFVFVKSMGGEWWDDLVNFTVEKGYWGIENLALIPGTVGASPVQNIGAYGVEIKDVIESVEAYEIVPTLAVGTPTASVGGKRIFMKEECEFGYRDSVFKNKFKGRYFISAIILKLQKTNHTKLEYKVIKEYLEKNNLEINSSKDVANIVAEIRRSKLPDPKVLGSAGSFFKNVYVSSEELKSLLEKYPNMPSFQEGEMIKIPSGWLIEQCGPNQSEISWKGYRVGNVGVHEKQALVLVNHGGATGEEIKNLAFEIIDSVYQKFGVKLTPEVNLI